MSKTKYITALLLGDVVGHPGGRALFVGLPQLIKEYRADVVVLNGENAVDGFGLSEQLGRTFFSYGVHVITSGNHIWQKEELKPYLESESRLLRPANYPPKSPGKGSTIVDLGWTKVGVLNLQGRHNMLPIDCPFQVGMAQIEKLRKQTPIILVDFHAELEQEKEAMGFYLDGKASVVVGTHTHVQTLDEKILPQGTAYITDMGMCGPLEGVIGSQPEISIQRQLTQIPLRNVIVDAPSHLQGVVCTIDSSSGKALSITRFSRSFGV